jgi:hypothetical protein
MGKARWVIDKYVDIWHQDSLWGKALLYPWPEGVQYPEALQEALELLSMFLVRGY